MKKQVMYEVNSGIEYFQIRHDEDDEFGAAVKAFSEYEPRYIGVITRVRRYSIDNRYKWWYLPTSDILEERDFT